MRKSLLSLLIATLSFPASAHIALVDPQAASGGNYAGFFRVSHGCAGSDTISLRITIPDNVISARPQP